MWSDRYNYYNIQFDLRFSQKLKKEIVVKSLLETNMFTQTNHQTFTNSSEFPWVDIVVIETYDGNFMASEKINEYATLIAIVCSKGEELDQSVYINTFKSIAEKIKWKLYLEEDDEGNENIEL